ncbi:MAG: RtcB family protein [Candidatus Schekmanbacteria bacterium]|nr:RtcB family protein [Candidatus Schekmanbacteria bacterium]
METVDKESIERVNDNKWKLNRTGSMRVDGVVYASSRMMEIIKNDQSLVQVANVATLPGIVGASFGMPDIHWGYGFPIGGVAAFDIDSGVVSPGGVGYDINCGVRLLRTDLTKDEVEKSLKELVAVLYAAIPSGVGSHRKDLRLTREEEKKVLHKGARWAVENGFGFQEDLEFIEDRGCIKDANFEFVSDRALERGNDQLGTLGSGNHFVEVGFVEEIYDEEAAKVFGLFKDGITVFIHSGSRGLGYQICDDYIKVMNRAVNKYGIDIPDRQLCAAPINSKEGREYLSAMAAAANYAFANRQIMSHWAREVFMKYFNISPSTLSMKLVYDVAHNIAKIEEHIVKGVNKRLCVHRKGATRAFPPGHPAIPSMYRDVGQPVLIPGDMGRCSYVLAGNAVSMTETFGSACHGAGRLMSRSEAKRRGRGRAIVRELEDKGIFVKAAGRETLLEEMPEAYKDVSAVVNVVHECGISRKVAKLRPLAVVKG